MSNASSKYAFDRRRFLKSVGGATVALPFMSVARNIAAAQVPALPKRVVFLTFEFGYAEALWKPTAVGRNFRLRQLSAPLEPFQDRCLFLSNVVPEALTMGSHALKFGHDHKMEFLLTGSMPRALLRNPDRNHIDEVDASRQLGGAMTPAGHSVCTEIERQLRDGHPLRAVNLTISGDDNKISRLRPSTSRGTNTSIFSYEAASTPVTSYHDAGAAFSRIFEGIEPDGSINEAYLEAQRKRKSVLDLVRDQYRDVLSGLQGADRTLLETHADNIRQIELSIAEGCTLPNRAGGNAGGLLQAWNRMARLVEHSVRCNLAPVYRMAFHYENRTRFGIPAIDNANFDNHKDGWHGILHADKGDTTYLTADYAIQAQRFFFERLADLMTRFGQIPDGPNGITALDTTLFFIGSDFADGHRSGHNVAGNGFVLAGNMGPVQGGLHVDVGAAGAHHHHLLVSILRMAGVQANEFGTAGIAQGPIPGLFA